MTYRTSKSRGNRLVLFQWLFAIVLGIGYSIAAYEVHPLGAAAGSFGVALFLLLNMAELLHHRGHKISQTSEEENKADNP